MKIILTLLVSVVLAHVARAGDPLWNAHEMSFKAHYHRWVAYIYEHPRIILSSSRRSFTELPDYDAIVKLGKPIVPFAAEEMMKKDSEFGVFLGDAIARIMGWKPEDYQAISLQDQNKRIYERLLKEKIVKEARK